MLAVLCAGVTCFYFWFVKRRNKKDLMSFIKNPFLALFVLLWLVRGLSIFFSKNLSASLLMYGFFTTTVFLMFFIFQHFKEDGDRVLKYLKFYIYIVFVLTLFGYFQYILQTKTGITIGALWVIPGNIPRIGATFWDVNHYGAFLAALMPLLGMFILTGKKLKTKIFYSLIFLSMLVTLFLTNSRTAWIMAFVSFISFICIFLVRKIGLKGISYVFVVLVLITIPLVREYSIKSSPFRARIKQYFHYRMDSFDSHFMLLTGAFQIFEKYPILGGGYGGFFEHFSKTAIASKYFGRDPAAFNTRVPPHTIWGEFISETGILGLSVAILLFGLIISVLLYSSLTLKNTSVALVLAAMVATMIGWLVAGIFYSYNAEFFWIIISLFFMYGVCSLPKGFSYEKIIRFFVSGSRFAFVTISVLALGLIFWKVGENHLIPWDEAIYAKISKNMVISNNYIVQTWKDGAPWYEKPSLYMWCMAIFMKVLGFTNLAAKLPSAIFGFLTVLAVFIFGKKLFSKSVGFISAFALLTTVHFLYYSRLSMTDITATFFITSSLFVYFLAKNSKKNLHFILSGILIGLAVMTKGVVGLLPFPIICLYELYLYLTKQQKISSRIFTNYVLLFISSAVIFVPWHFEMYRRFGLPFLYEYLGYHVWDRAINAIEDKGNPFWWYLIVMKVSMRLWFIALLFSLPFVLKKIVKKDNRFVFLAIWAGFVLLFFSIAKSKLVWYIIPIYPAVSLIVGFFLERFLPKKNYVFRLLALFAFVVSGLTYLFYVRGIVYVSDLTGPVARLLQLKDKELGTKDVVYIDRVELPIKLFYTDGPFEGIDYSPAKGRIPLDFYDKRMIILGKRGRFMEQQSLYGKEPIIVGEEKDWVLWYYPSGFEIDKNRQQKTLGEKVEAMKSLFQIY